MVTAFVAARQKLQAVCRALSGTQLLHIERKRVYELQEFAAVQRDHQQQVRVQDLGFTGRTLMLSCIGSSLIHIGSCTQC